LSHQGDVPPSGGSLEIGNIWWSLRLMGSPLRVPPSGGSLEIGNKAAYRAAVKQQREFPLRGDP